MAQKTSIFLTGILSGLPQGIDKPPGKYVYQKTKPGLGNMPGDKSKRVQCRVWVQGELVNTPAQQPYRARFAEGVAAWHALTISQKETYRAPGKKRGLNRFQMFMRQWNLSMSTPTATTWDGGTTTWDGGTTTWELI